jgi:hypothetical protein
VWLVGMDGNEHDPEDTSLVATQQRMLERRMDHRPKRPEGPLIPLLDPGRQLVRWT